MLQENKFFIRDNFLKSDDDLKTLGIPSNTTRSFSLLPETWEGWMGLVKSIRKNMRLRNYELTTLAAAMEMGCTF